VGPRDFSVIAHEFILEIRPACSALAAGLPTWGSPAANGRK